MSIFFIGDSLGASPNNPQKFITCCTNTAVAPRPRRQFSREFKQQIVVECQLGVSVAGVAMANDINPNQLQRWIRECRADDMGLAVRSTPSIKLVPLAVQSSSSLADSMIEITLSGKKRSASLRWPVSSVAGLAALLRDVLA